MGLLAKNWPFTQVSYTQEYGSEVRQLAATLNHAASHACAKKLCWRVEGNCLMRSALWKRLIPAVGLLILTLAFAFPGGAQAAPTAKAAASQSSAKAAPKAAAVSCFAYFTLEAYHYGWDAEASGTYLYFAGSADEFCQQRVSINSANVIIYDVDALNSPGDDGYCLAYNSTNNEVYLHPSCGTANYEQWKFLSQGGNLYMAENGYPINNAVYCMTSPQSGGVATLGVCNTTTNPGAVLYYNPV